MPRPDGLHVAVTFEQTEADLLPGRHAIGKLARRMGRAMRRSHFSEDQIIGVLREKEAKVKTAELCLKCAISDATFSNWMADYSRMTVLEAARWRTLELRTLRVDGSTGQD